MSQVQDIAFREIEKHVVSTEVVVKVSHPSKQPKHIGFGFVIHVPTEVFARVPKTTLRALGDAGMEAEAKQPIFYKTKIPFARITFNRGDAKTALKAYATFKAATSLVFKNWL